MCVCRWCGCSKNRSVSLLTSKPFFSMLAPLHAAQQRRQRALKRARRLVSLPMLHGAHARLLTVLLVPVIVLLQAGEAEYTPSAGVDDDEEDAGGFVVFGNEADDFVPDYEDYAGMADEDAGGNEDAATSRFGGEDGPMPMNLDADMERSLADAPTSYEELCRHHIVRTPHLVGVLGTPAVSHASTMCVGGRGGLYRRLSCVRQTGSRKSLASHAASWTGNRAWSPSWPRKSYARRSTSTSTATR